MICGGSLDQYSAKYEIESELKLAKAIVIEIQIIK